MALRFTNRKRPKGKRPNGDPSFVGPNIVADAAAVYTESRRTQSPEGSHTEGEEEEEEKEPAMSYLTRNWFWIVLAAVFVLGFSAFCWFFPWTESRAAKSQAVNGFLGFLVAESRATA